MVEFFTNFVSVNNLSGLWKSGTKTSNELKIKEQKTKQLTLKRKMFTLIRIEVHLCKPEYCYLSRFLPSKSLSVQDQKGPEPKHPE